jgi:hypothetical protein
MIDNPEIEIPEDIKLAADACYLESEQLDSYGIVKVIGRFILAERERCADVADYFARSAAYAEWSEDARGSAYYSCSDVATAIRSPTDIKPMQSVVDDDALPF